MLTTLCAIGALIGPATLSWLFPPEPAQGGEPAMNDPEFRRLMTLVEQSLQQSQTIDDGTGIVITHGPGLSIP